AGLGDLADIGRRNRHFAPEAESLDEAEDQHRVVAPGERADDAEDREYADRPDRGRNAADALCEPAKEDRADELAGEAGGDEQADLPRRKLPHADEDRKYIGNRERVERIEEERDAHDDAELQVPRRQRQPLDARGDLLG